MSGKVKIILKRILIFITITIVMLLTFLYSVIFICTKGPSTKVRDIFVMSVRETSAVGFLANICLSKSEIAEIVKANTVEEVADVTDISLIHVKNNDEYQYISDNEELETEDVYVDENGIKIINITSDMYKGKLAIIKDPSRVHVGISGKYGKEEKGKTLPEIAKNSGAILATNAGGFVDDKGFGLGGEPLGMVINGGKLLYGEPDTVYNVCGFNKENVMIVGYMTPKKALSMNIRDAVSFGPVLIVNGEAAPISGSGGGMNPRTAIGQRSDGSVLLLVLDGRQASSFGATYQDIINIMLKYGAVNAFNLDGGSSSAMYYNGKIINSMSVVGSMRDLPTAIIVQ